ncbi:Uma2 family endonuclease [Nocardia transvalensis]|uniref:Uma2 family endonuclease n=1 Tax=Nocardia transvalensis TaxID=37333 RepID=A0A7W9PAZ7_9NOCA|nr:Uma2 family endonuclease [Nocardia transvalensis]MBB5912418.1 Uma2 family endonuclease [Nocardia transvalensis]
MSEVFDWAREENLQPAPITLEIWKKLPEEFCRLVEVVNGEAVRAESPLRAHQKAARRLAAMVESAAETHMGVHNDGCLDVDTDFDVVLWELPRVTIRRPDVALFRCAPGELRPLPASMIELIIEVVSPGTERVDTADKLAEYAQAGIPWYWIAWVADNRVVSIETHVLDHVLRQYRPHAKLQPSEAESVVDVPIRIRIEWGRLDGLTR